MAKEVYNIEKEFDPFGENNLVWDVRIVPDTFEIVQYEEDILFWHINIVLELKKDTPYALSTYRVPMMYRFKWIRKSKNNRVLMRHTLERKNLSGMVVGLSKITLYNQDITKGVENTAHNLVKEMLTCIASDNGANVRVAFKC